jgi:hypothetical protein
MPVAESPNIGQEVEKRKVKTRNRGEGDEWVGPAPHQITDIDAPHHRR